ncbi:hypothetical protein BHM03_00019074 [Ensete ventricosum]|nr:hypothetical protein BHM03_00019074 [Ensete ventricosum]
MSMTAGATVVSTVTTVMILKNQIEDLIHRGHLDRFIRKPRELSLSPKGPVERQIDVIVGGPAMGGDSSSARKAYARVEVQKRPRARYDLEITFEFESEYLDHDDTLVITACIANAHVKRIMINTWSSANILYFDTFLKLDMTNQNLTPMTSTLTGFTGDAIITVGIATLPMIFDDEPRTKTLMVVELPSAVISTYHHSMKFSTSAGVEDVRSDPRGSRQCYMAATTISKKGMKETPAPDPWELIKPDTRPEPTEPILEVPLEKDHPEKTVRKLASRRTLTCWKIIEPKRT